MFFNKISERMKTRAKTIIYSIVITSIEVKESYILTNDRMDPKKKKEKEKLCNFLLQVNSV
jgi:hypothetical protein